MTTSAVCVVARNEAAHLRPSLTQLVALREAGEVDDVYLLDGGSTDESVALARSVGADVIEAATVCPEAGPLLGKGDSMWRAGFALPHELVAFFDGDITIDHAQAVPALLAPLDADAGVHLVKGYFRRRTEHQQGYSGGRVTELVIRPALALLAPDLCRYVEPLSGQVALRTGTLRTLDVVTGYGIEIAMLFDVVARFGHEGVAQADLGTIVNPPQSDTDLGAMAVEVLATLLERLHRHGRLGGPGAAAVAARAIRHRPVERAAA